MRIKRLILIGMILFAFSCGKKEMPPSPDIFAPDISSVSFYINNQIRISFSEKVSEISDSVKLNGTDTVSARVFFKDNSMLIPYDIPPLSVSLFGIRDQAGNTRDFRNVKIKGSPIQDTLKPRLERIVFRDTMIIAEFDEPLSSVFYRIYPEYIRDSSVVSNRADVFFSDTLMKYPVQIIIDSFCDMSGNMNNARNEKLFTYPQDTLPLRTMEYSSYPDKELEVVDADNYIIRNTYVNADGNVIIEKLPPGYYVLRTDMSVKDTILE